MVKQSNVSGSDREIRKVKGPHCTENTSEPEQKTVSKGDYNMLKLKKVNVQFVYEGISDKTDFETGALFPDGRVLVDIDGISLYDGIPTDYPDLYVVNLDVSDKDYLQGKGSEAFIDLITK